MLGTSDYLTILAALGGEPENLADNMEKTMIDAIFAQIKTNTTGRVPTAAEVLAAIQGMDATQKTAVKTALGIS